MRASLNAERQKSASLQPNATFSGAARTQASGTIPSPEGEIAAAEIPSVKSVDKLSEVDEIGSTTAAARTRAQACPAFLRLTSDNAIGLTA